MPVHACTCQRPPEPWRTNDYWPTADQDPDISAELVEFAGIWREMPKRTLPQAGWNTTVLHDVVPEQVAELKAQPGGDIALSGANSASTFVRHGLTNFGISSIPWLWGRAGRCSGPLVSAWTSGSRGRGRSATAWFCSTTRATPPKRPTR